MRFQGGYSSFLSGRKSFGNLWNLSDNTTDVVHNHSNFHALNINYSANQKLDINGYIILSKTLQKTENISEFTYLQTLLYENRNEKSEKKNKLFSTNLKFEYSPKKNTKWFYNIYSEASNNIVNSYLNSYSNFENTAFENLSNADIWNVRQYIERHQKHNKAHTTTLVINHSFDQSKPLQTWVANKPFLTGLIPIQNDTEYYIEKLKKISQNRLDILFKHYYAINNNHHLYSIIGNQYTKNQYITDEKQVLTNGIINDFSKDGFGNNVNYLLNDFYTALEYKFRIKKWVNKPMIYLHFYNLETIQNEKQQQRNCVFFEPQWLSEYEFNGTEKITFFYSLKNEFPTENLIAENYTLQNFNSVFKGNALIKNEQFHKYSLNYTKNNLYRGLLIFANASYTNKIKNIRNTVVLDGIDQVTTPLLYDLPEKKLGF